MVGEEVGVEVSESVSVSCVLEWYYDPVLGPVAVLPGLVWDAWDWEMWRDRDKLAEIAEREMVSR